MKMKPIYKWLMLVIWGVGIAVWIGCGEGDEPITQEDDTDNNPPVVVAKGSLSGQVERIDGVEVSVRLLRGAQEIAVVGADADGSYKFDNLTPGNYVVQFTAKGYQTAELSVQVVENQVASLDRITLEAFAEPVSHLRGAVFDQATRKTLKDVLVKLIDADGNTFEATTLVAGAFAFENVPADEAFTLLIEHEDYEDYEAEVDPIPAGETAKLEIELLPVDRDELPLGDGLTIGTQAPAFSLPDENGVVRSLADYAGKKLVIVFDRGRW